MTDWEQLTSLKQSHKHSIPVCFYYTDSGKALHSQSAVYAFVYLRYNKNKRGRIIFSVEFLSCLFFISIRRPIPRKISAWSKDRNSKVSRGAARPLAGRIQRNRRFRGTRLSMESLVCYTFMKQTEYGNGMHHFDARSISVLFCAKGSSCRGRNMSKEKVQAK